MKTRKKPIPSSLLTSMARCMISCHMDENAGVPIGARSMAFEVLSHFLYENMNAEFLRLGLVSDSPSEWAAYHCTNPVRSQRNRKGSTQP